MEAEVKITDELAISIRGLWHIESMEEKKKLIRYYDNLYRLFLLIKKHPELFTPEELKKYKQKSISLTEADKKLISEIFVTLHMGIVTPPPDYTIEEVKDFYSKGLYFTKEELDEMVELQLYSTSNYDLEFFILLVDYLDKHLYFDTIEEAEKVWEEYDATHPNGSHQQSTVYLSTDFSTVDFSRSSCSTPPSTISLS